jgi:hypothetical protein
MNVVDQNGVAFTKANQNTPREINTITLSGTQTALSRLVGRVTPAAGSDGRVFFQTLNVLPTGQYSQLDPNLVFPRATIPQNGIAAVDMPHFWLGHTSTETPSFTSSLHSGFEVAGGINAAEGIQVLRMGGVDTTYTPAGGTPLNSTSQNNEFIVNLGTPVTIGTSIILDRVVTNAALGVASGTTPAPVFQQSVTFLVTGRLNLFQANQIQGNANPSVVPTQFRNSTDSGGASPGGTYVVSMAGASIGQIGNIRIGGDATNFTAFALATDVFSTPNNVSIDPKISNFFIGGETNNVLLISPGGTRNVYFGRGMDNTQINTLFIQNLQANRGAVNSSVTADRQISNVVMGGDVVDTDIQSGYVQTIASYANTPAATFTAGGGAFNGVAVPDIVSRIQNSLTGILQPLAHGGGAMDARVAGNVVNSIFSVGVDPAPSGINQPGQFQLPVGKTFPFGAPENISLPQARLKVKVEGVVDNSGLQAGTSPFVDPNLPSSAAFFSQHLKVYHGPVIPPNVPQAPYPGPTVFFKGQSPLQGLFQVDGTLKRKKS